MTSFSVIRQRLTSVAVVPAPLVESPHQLIGTDDPISVCAEPIGLSRNRCAVFSMCSNFAVSLTASAGIKALLRPVRGMLPTRQEHNPLWTW